MPLPRSPCPTFSPFELGPKRRGGVGPSPPHTTHRCSLINTAEGDCLHVRKFFMISVSLYSSKHNQPFFCLMRQRFQRFCLILPDPERLQFEIGLPSLFVLWFPSSPKWFSSRVEIPPSFFAPKEAHVGPRALFFFFFRRGGREQGEGGLTTAKTCG